MYKCTLLANLQAAGFMGKSRLFRWWILFDIRNTVIEVQNHLLTILVCQRSWRAFLKMQWGSSILPDRKWPDGKWTLFIGNWLILHKLSVQIHNYEHRIMLFVIRIVSLWNFHNIIVFMPSKCKDWYVNIMSSGSLFHVFIFEDW